MTKITLLSLILFAITSSLLGQKDPNKLVKPILEEGKLLYNSERASWHGTDLFLKEYSKKENIGGYFSYTKNNLTKCIFFSREGSPKIIGTITFDDTFDSQNAKKDFIVRKFTKFEKDLYAIRKNALEAIQTDSLFKSYQNTNLNVIPLIHNNIKKVYILTGPKIGGVVIFGNDYLITFDKKNNILEKKALHKNIIPIEYGQKGEQDQEVVGTMHTHLEDTGHFITATDICTLMLYCKYTKWKSHNVVSEKYLNMWDCENNTLAVISMDAVKKIEKDQKKRNSKQNKKQ